jgi:hypothetical protein
MDELRPRVTRAEVGNTKAQLREKIGRELGDEWVNNVPSNLNTEWMRVCYERISGGEDPYERLAEQHDNYSSQWVTDKNEQVHYATALKLLLHERVGRAEDDVLRRQTATVLAEILVALQTNTTELADQWNTEADRAALRAAAPTRTVRPEPTFEDTLAFEDALTPALDDWIARRNPDEDAQVVYVLDCTPPIGDEEDSKVESLRGRVAQSDAPETGPEYAARAANNDEVVYYVGSRIGDLATRLQQHEGRASTGGAAFTGTFLPVSLVDAKWYGPDVDIRAVDSVRDAPDCCSNHDWCDHTVRNDSG